MSIVEGTITLFVGYLFGCFQTSYIISKLVSKKDIRNLGSGNAGASNVTSEFGWKYGILTGLLDILKAYLPAKIALYYFINILQPLDIIVLAGTGAILGHIYPLFLNFRGGKGIACYIGMLLAIDLQIGLITILTLMLITIITDYVSIGSIFLYIFIPIYTYISGEYSLLIIRCVSILCLVGLIKHWINIQRIINGNEIGLRDVYNKNKSN